MSPTKYFYFLIDLFVIWVKTFDSKDSGWGNLKFDDTVALKHKILCRDMSLAFKKLNTGPIFKLSVLKYIRTNFYRKLMLRRFEYFEFRRIFNEFYAQVLRRATES